MAVPYGRALPRSYPLGFLECDTAKTHHLIQRGLLMGLSEPVISNPVEISFQANVPLYGYSEPRTAG